MILYVMLLLGLIAACPPDCAACNSLSCVACSEGSQLTVDGLCTTSQLLPHCSVYFSANICSKCVPTYSLTVASGCQKDYSGCIQFDIFTGECVLCLFGKKLVNGVCEGILNCQQYNGSSCVRCKDNFISNQSLCLFNGAGCAKVEKSTGSCLECQKQYNLIGYQCILRADSLPNCYLYEGRQCLVCKTGYSLNSIAMCVLPPDQLCGEYDPFNNCIRCNNSKLVLSNNSCVDPHCLKGKLGSCQECKKGFSVKDNGLCLLSDSKCSKVNLQGTECQSCQNGYFINAEGTCSLLPVNCAAADIIKLTCIACKSGFIFKGQTCVQLTIISNCLLMSPARTSCLVCQYNYFLAEGACKRVSALCNGYDPGSGMCLNCKVGYINYGGKCVDPNCQTQNQDICQQCKPSFSIQNNGLCYFYDPNCASATVRNCLSCKVGFYLNGNSCSALPLNCEEVDQTGNCQRCLSGYSLSGLLCIIPITGCFEYQLNSKNVSICIRCQLGFNLVNGSCELMAESDPNCISVKGGVCVLCSNRFFFSSGKCVPVNPTCKSYSMQTGLCTDCYPGYMLYNGSCPPAPPKDSNCKTISPEGCVECYQSYFLRNGTCNPINTLCKTSNSSSGQCLSCYTGYSLKNGKCLTTYADPNCAKYDQEGVCANCSAKYYMRDGLCTRVSPLCKTYNIDTGVCLTCYPGYYLAGGACWAGNDPNLDANCNLRSLTGACLQCIASYYLADNGYCKAANPLCRTFNNSNGDCLSCYRGYVLKEKTCALESSGSTDPNCLKFLPSGLCEQCYVRFYVSGGVCKEINTLCRSANYSDGSCLSCYPGYSLSHGNCIIPNLYNQQAQDPYCSSFQDQKCVLCRSGYYLQSGTCALIDPQCQNFDYKASRCANCYQGYVLTDWGCSIQAQAVIPFCQSLNADKTCQICVQGYYKQTPLSCAAVSILCYTYDQNTGFCTSCRGGYFLQDGSCVYPAMGFDSQCISYDTSAYCNQCKPGFYIYNYICTRVDVNCVNFDYQAKSCNKCGNGMTPFGADCKAK